MAGWASLIPIGASILGSILGGQQQQQAANTAAQDQLNLEQTMFNDYTNWYGNQMGALRGAINGINSPYFAAAGMMTPTYQGPSADAQYFGGGGLPGTVAAAQGSGIPGGAPGGAPITAPSAPPGVVPPGGFRPISIPSGPRVPEPTPTGPTTIGGRLIPGPLAMPQGAMPQGAMPQGAMPRGAMIAQALSAPGPRRM